MNVYVVTTGSYSDYGIHAIFSTPDLAETCRAELAKANQDPNEVQKWQVDEKVDQVAKPYWTVRMELLTGNIFEVCHVPENRQMIDRDQKSHKVHGVIPAAGARLLLCTDLAVTSYVSEEHALKVAAEYRQELLRRYGGVGNLQPDAPGGLLCFKDPGQAVLASAPVEESPS